MLPRLNPDPGFLVDVQQTEFSHDMLGRWVCSTSGEVSGNGGDPFDVIVIGSGMFGGYIADKICRRGEDIGLRVLVVEAGAFLLPTHVQNLPRLGLFGPAEQVVASNAQDPGPQNLVWGHPWHSNQAFPGLAYCIGGRSLFWGGWSPILTPADLGSRPAGQVAWPSDVVTYLNANYASVAEEMGAKPTDDFISGKSELVKALRARFEAVIDPKLVEDAPLSVQAQAPVSAPGLFPFDKYSSAYLLFDAVRQDIEKHWRGNIDAWRRLMVLPRAQVVRLTVAGNRVTELELLVNGQQQVLRPPLISPDCTVVLAAGTIESTRLALDSLPPPATGANRMGSNLMAHLRSDITARIRRPAIIGTPPTELEIAALLVRGTTSDGHQYHFQVTASAGAGSDDNLFAALPDLDFLEHLRANQDPDWVPITLRAIGQMIGHPSAQPGDVKKSWINLAWQNDPRTGRPRAWVNLDPSDADMTAWGEMENAAVDVLKKLAGGLANIQNQQINVNRNNIGTTHHEAGTLWMGATGQSVTDSFGKFHNLANTYVAGPALFPVIGSANPSLTATTLAGRTADAIVAAHTIPPSPAFKPLFTGSRQGWQMAGGGDFLTLFGTILEAAPNGLGLLWYTREAFRNFILQVDYLSFNPTTNAPLPARADNGGILIRFPALNSSNTATDWQLASDKGYEIQIDDMGYNVDTNSNFSPLHQTGAVYGLAPSSHIASKGAGQWNTFEIEATNTAIKVTLNGQVVTNYTIPATTARLREGHIGVQNHTGNVQYKNILIRSLP
jgi:choline dehydrogenase-like flavoprotein